MPRRKSVSPKKTAKNSKINPTVENGFAEAMGFPSNGLFGAGNNSCAPQISQTNTLFENLRWYLASNLRQPLSEAYVEIGLIQTIIDVPVDDGLRGGIEIQSQQLSEDQIKDLLISIDRDNNLQIAGQASKWMRLYGGAGIVIMVDDQDPEEPLDINSITEKSNLKFRAADMWELFSDTQNIDDLNPMIYGVESEHYMYYANKIHKSRVMLLMGRTAPSFLRPRLKGWGLSEVETLVRSVNQYLKATDLTFSCLDEFKVDVFKIKDLVNTLLSPQGEQKVRQRINLANAQKNYQNALVMDKEDEWDHKQISFSGIAETMEGIRMQVAADMHFPITKLFGTSASKGLGNTDQNDMENYNSMVESQVRGKLKYNILTMLEIKCQAKYGFVPSDLEIRFKPLRVLSAVEEETVKTSQFARLMQARQIGEISSRDFKESCNKANLLPVQLDASLEALPVEDADEQNKPDQKEIA